MTWFCDSTRSRRKVAFLEPRMGGENGEMNLSVRNCRATPACNTKRTPSIDGPLSAHGWTLILQPATRRIKQRPNQLQRHVRHKLQSLLYDKSSHCGPIRADRSDTTLNQFIMNTLGKERSR